MTWNVTTHVLESDLPKHIILTVRNGFIQNVCVHCCQYPPKPPPTDHTWPAGIMTPSNSTLDLEHIRLERRFSQPLSALLRIDDNLQNQYCKTTKNTFIHVLDSVCSYYPMYFRGSRNSYLLNLYGSIHNANLIHLHSSLHRSYPNYLHGLVVIQCICMTQHIMLIQYICMTQNTINTYYFL